jgi:poly(A) polymerase
MWRTEPKIVARANHTVSRRNIDEDALKVLRRLGEHGHTAYLVGGGVRDLLLGRQPKDFDVSTSAHPNEIKRIFRNCFLIGRRFRLAHIRFGYHKIIETSTFRSQPKTDGDANDPEVDLYHRDDNEFGTPEEDARRRDFTINGLFYDLKDFSIIDHVGGLTDLRKGLVRSIGDANVRFREDPVRMVRAVRFASRLGFKIESRTRKAILKHSAEIEKASPARMLEEIYRLFAFHSGEAAFRLLYETGLMRVIFPELDGYIRGSGVEQAVLWRCLAALDSGQHWHAEPTPALMFAALYTAALEGRAEQERQAGHPVVWPEFVDELMTPVLRRLVMPKRVQYALLRILADQEKMAWIDEDAQGGAPKRFSQRRFIHHEAFAESLALLGIRAAAGLANPVLVTRWQALAEEAGGGEATVRGDDRKRHPAPRGGARRRPPRRRRRGPPGGNAGVPAA